MPSFNPFHGTATNLAPSLTQTPQQRFYSGVANRIAKGPAQVATPRSSPFQSLNTMRPQMQGRQSWFGGAFNALNQR